VYRHALLRDAGYASLARGERSTLHARFADWLAGFPGDSLPTLAEVIARHYAAAIESAPSLSREIDGRAPEDLRATAAGWFERAAEVASRFAAWESARTLAQSSLELTAEGSPLLQGQRLERLAEATANTAGVDEAEEHLRRALDLYRAAGGKDVPEARAGLATVGASLGRLVRAQTRFEEAERLATALLDEIDGPDDAAVARLLLLRSVAVMNAWDDYDRAEIDATRALPLVRAAGDPALELEALQLMAQIGSERGDDTAEAWLAIEELARGSGRWETMAGAIRSRAFAYVDDEPDRALPLVEAAAEVAGAYGLVEAGGWADYMRAEAHMSAGRWEEALAAGLRAIEVGEAHGYHRVVVRSWFTVLPVARAQGREDLIQQAFPRFESRARIGHEADSYYARIVATATHLHFAAFGLEPAFVPNVEARLPCFDMDHGTPSWVAGIETVVGAWVDAGELAAAHQALDRMRARLSRGHATHLARATEALLRARLLLARGEDSGAVAEAERALAATAASAPWWRAKAIRILQQAGAAAEPLVDEAKSIEARLGISY
jgi:tetratricopeptide (TPR) repeat protein